jgi:hypothetical protein
MKDLIARTRILFDEVFHSRNRWNGIPASISKCSAAVVAILHAIESKGYGTLHRRPSISKTKQLWLLCGALFAI